MIGTQCPLFARLRPLYIREQTFAAQSRTSAIVKGCRTPVADRRCGKLGRQVSDKPQGRKPRAGYAGWRSLLWGKCDWCTWLDRMIGFDAVAAIGSRWLSGGGEGIVAAVEAVDGGSLW